MKYKPKEPQLKHPRCPECDSILYNNEALTAHMENCHPPKESKKCSQCKGRGQWFESTSSSGRTYCGKCEGSGKEPKEPQIELLISHDITKSMHDRVSNVEDKVNQILLTYLNRKK